MERYFERRYYLSELFYKEAEETLGLIIFYISMFNFVIGSFVVATIITQTPASMRAFRNLLLAVLICSMSFEVFNIFYKPAVLLPLPIFVPVNPIRGITDALEYVGPFICIINMAVIMDLLLSMVIQRYFTMSNLIVSHPKYLEISVYGFVVITDIIMIILIVLSNTVTGDRLDKAQTIAFIQTYIIDWEKLLAISEFPCITTIFLRNDPISHFERYYTIFFYGSRLFGFILFTFKNMRLIIGTNETTPEARKQHRMIIKLLKFEFFAALFFIIIPTLLLLYVIAIQVPSPMIPMYCNLLIKFYPPVDTLLTSLLIKPYRSFMRKIICKIFRLKNSQVSDSSSTPIDPKSNVLSRA